MASSLTTRSCSRWAKQLDCTPSREYARGVTAACVLLGTTGACVRLLHTLILAHALIASTMRSTTRLLSTGITYSLAKTHASLPASRTSTNQPPPTRPASPPVLHAQPIQSRRDAPMDSTLTGPLSLSLHPLSSHSNIAQKKLLIGTHDTDRTDTHGDAVWYTGSLEKRVTHEISPPPHTHSIEQTSARTTPTLGVFHAPPARSRMVLGSALDSTSRHARMSTPIATLATTPTPQPHRGHSPAIYASRTFCRAPWDRTSPSASRVLWRMPCARPAASSLHPTQSPPMASPTDRIAARTCATRLASTIPVPPSVVRA